MFSEVVKLQPQIDRARLSRMFTDLNTRFAGVAKRFGQGMRNALRFGGAGGIAGLAAGLLTKLLNPLKKAEEALERILKMGDDAVTNAEDLGTTPGKLLRLQALGAAKGLSPEELNRLLLQFQSALADEQEQAKSFKAQQEALPAEQRVARDPDAGLLREFVDETDIADAFFEFIQSLQHLDKSRQVTVQNEVFGEKMRGKAREFFNAKDFAGLLADLPSDQALDEAANKAGALADTKDRLDAIRGLEDIVTKAKLIGESQVKAQDRNARRELGYENDALVNFDQLKAADDAMESLIKKVEKAITKLTVEFIPPFVEAVNSISKLVPSASETKDVASGFLESTAQKLVALEDRKAPPGVDPATRIPAEDFTKKSAPSDEDMAQAFRNLRSTIEGIWAEFKSSRFYKMFGG